MSDPLFRTMMQYLVEKTYFKTNPLDLSLMSKTAFHYPIQEGSRQYTKLLQRKLTNLSVFELEKCNIGRLPVPQDGKAST